ncbi:hypothetical protein TNCV_3159881 [Trichonephila clavipes]|nr:hypothetical protein TNCV_3159881 [Trichonephila clavipes]
MSFTSNQKSSVKRWYEKSKVKQSIVVTSNDAYITVVDMTDESCHHIAGYLLHRGDSIEVKHRGEFVISAAVSWLSVRHIVTLKLGGITGEKYREILAD